MVVEGDTKKDACTQERVRLELPKGVSLIDEINKLRKEKNAIILAHYYQSGDIQDIADYLGDSLQLARAAEKTNASMIVFLRGTFYGRNRKNTQSYKKSNFARYVGRMFSCQFMQ